MRQPMPHGFRQTVSGSGLILPEALSREREVWTEAEGRLLERTTKLLAERGILMLLKCSAETCREAPIQSVRLDEAGILLRCAHKDRHLQRAF